MYCSSLHISICSHCLHPFVILDSLYQSSILGGFFVSGTIPLFYELTVESTYPVAEGVTTGLLTLINNSFTVIFLLVLMIPGVGEWKINTLLTHLSSFRSKVNSLRAKMSLE